MAAKKSKTAKRTATRRGGRAAASSSRSQSERRANLAVEQVVPADAIALLEQDHREVEALFEQFGSLEDSKEKAKLAAKICLALTAHAEVEEKIFYPASRRETCEEDRINEALVEHASAKQLIADIETMTPRSKLFDATVKVLGEYIKHHVREEEDELFPLVRQADVDLIALGRKMLKRKIALLAELTDA